MRINTLENSIAEHQPLPDKIANFVREAIIVGKLRPGEKISEAKLADELHISRTPIREAIRMLESEGFVSIIPRRGTIVSEFSLEDFYEYFQVKACLEGFAAASVADQLSERELNKLKKLNEEEMVAVKAGDFTQYLRIHDEFHQAFLSRTGNSKLLGLIQHMGYHIRRLERIFTDHPEIFVTCSETHKDLIAAFEARDGARAREIVERNILHIADNLKRYGAEFLENGKA
ncbi:MAG: GntR family transcriptional regulator [Deltaproteobacteria bacterium]|nr:GntR family transcriptional regulator [Deltaproteobacteria bacterium]